jgi:preprotein translocase subunit YajC
MKIRIGGKVRSIGGVEGKVIAVSDDRHSVMVKVPGTWRGTGIVSIPLVRLKAIEAYTSHDGPNGPFSTPA